MDSSFCYLVKILSTLITKLINRGESKAKKLLKSLLIVTAMSPFQKTTPLSFGVS